jgi:hypothetical protein
MMNGKEFGRKLLFSKRSIFPGFHGWTEENSEDFPVSGPIFELNTSSIQV